MSAQRARGSAATGGEALRRLVRLLVIAWELLAEVRRYRRFVRGHADATVPERFVERLVRLRPTFVKLGQVMSTRPDLLPAACVDALARLQESGPKLSFETVRAIVEAELGEPLDASYATGRAKVEQVQALSTHADYREMLDWLAKGPLSSRKVFVTYGEPSAADVFRRRIVDTFGWDATVPGMGDTVALE